MQEWQQRTPSNSRWWPCTHPDRYHTSSSRSSSRGSRQAELHSSCRRCPTPYRHYNQDSIHIDTLEVQILKKTSATYTISFLTQIRASQYSSMTLTMIQILFLLFCANDPERYKDYESVWHPLHIIPILQDCHNTIMIIITWQTTTSQATLTSFQDPQFKSAWKPDTFQDHICQNIHYKTIIPQNSARNEQYKKQTAYQNNQKFTHYKTILHPNTKDICN